MYATLPLLPLLAFDRITTDAANGALVEWHHYLGACERPFGMQAFGLWLDGALVAVAVSASTVGASCAERPRGELVELARLCTHPDHADMTRVTLRLWRKVAASQWARYWPVSAYVSYSTNVRHAGTIYRFDGWQRWGVVDGSTGGGQWSRTQSREDKTIWLYPL